MQPSQNEQQKERQERSVPVCIIDGNISILHCSHTETVQYKYAKLDNAMIEIELFKPDENIHLADCKQFQNYDQRYKFFQGLSRSVDVHMLRYDPGAGLGSISYIWRGPTCMSYEELFAYENTVLSSIRSKLMEHHTRTMRRDFQTMYGTIAGSQILQHVLRAIIVTRIQVCVI